MSPAARTVHVFGFYLVAVGLTLVAVPNVLLTVVAIPTTDEPWIRLLGVLLLALSGYYLVAARHELTALFRVSVAARVFVGAGLVVLSVLWGYWAGIAFGLVDIAGAFWTRAALAAQPEGQAAVGAGEPG